MKPVFGDCVRWQNCGVLAGDAEKTVSF